MAAAQHRQMWWPGRMAAAFGPSFLCLVCLIYFIQVSLPLSLLPLRRILAFYPLT
jgi:hypothetical protein